MNISVHLNCHYPDDRALKFFAYSLKKGRGGDATVLTLKTTTFSARNEPKRFAQEVCHIRKKAKEMADFLGVDLAEKTYY